jgi:hypothetical protein
MNEYWNQYLNTFLGRNRPTLGMYIAAKEKVKYADMLAIGWSKHLLHFFSSIVNDRIYLRKEEFVKLYEEGKSLKEIAELHNIVFADITFCENFLA